MHSHSSRKTTSIAIGIACCFSLSLGTIPAASWAQTVAGGLSTAELQQRRSQLLKTLKMATYLLEQEDYKRAAAYFLMPPNTQPSMLKSFTRNQETSLEGVKRLEDEATLGPATEIFEIDRANAFAKKSGVAVEDCFGFNYQTNQGIAEVLAVWQDGRPRLIRLDDVGKIARSDPWPRTDFSGKPDKATLIRTLQSAYTLINGFQLDAASELFVMPADVDRQQLLQLIENQEISPAGIKLLEQQGRFVSAINAVGPGRAKTLADRAGVELESCFGMALKTERDSGEVLAHWDGTRFRIFRLNNLGKMTSRKSPKAEAQDNGQRSPNQMNPADDDDLPAPSTPAKERLTREQLLSRLPKLEQAVADNPADLDAKIKYSFALNEVGNYPAAWVQAFTAYQQAPENPRVVTFLNHAFKNLEAAGVFTIGVPRDTIESLLGKPTEQLKFGDSFERMVYGFKAVDLKEGRVYRDIDLRGVTEAHFETDELMQTTVPLGWVCTQRKIDRGASTVVYMPAGETPKQWQRHFEIQRFPNLAGQLNPRQMAGKMENQLKQRFKTTKTTFIESNQDSVLVANVFEMETAGARRYQLVRFATGRDDLHRVSVTFKAKPSESDIEDWTAILKAAKVKLADQ